MASVFDYFGLRAHSDYTSVPQLGINRELGLLQRESEHYFIIPKSAQAKYGQVLAVQVQEGQGFLSTTSTHSALLKNCTAMFQAKSAQLHQIDQKILGGIAFGVAATVLSFLPLIGFLGWIGWGAASYYMNQRMTAYAEYHEALTLLVGACNWSLGPDSTQRKDTVVELTGNDAVRAMMVALYPVLTKIQVQHLIADDIEAHFEDELHHYESQFQLGFQPHRFFSKKEDVVALNKKGAEFHRCIYGFNKGGMKDFFDAIVSVIPDLYKALLHGVQQVRHWWQTKNQAAQESHERSQGELHASESGLIHP